MIFKKHSNLVKFLRDKIYWDKRRYYRIIRNDIGGSFDYLFVIEHARKGMIICDNPVPLVRFFTHLISFEK